MGNIPFSIIGTHLIEIQVKVNRESTKFLFDTGIGPTVLSKNLVNKYSLKQVGVMHGRRMSGQDLEIPLVKVPSLETGGMIRRDVEVGVFDTSAFPAFLSDVQGLLSIGFFEGKVVTVDYLNSSIIVTETPLKDDALSNGIRIPIDVEHDGPSASLYVKVKLPNGKTGKFEVDTGSDVLIMNLKLMNELGISPEDSGVETFTGTDETGHNYKRYRAEVKGNISLEGAPEIFHENPKVLFQDIIHDGLIGHDFLKRYTVSYNLNTHEMIFYKR